MNEEVILKLCNSRGEVLIKILAVLEEEDLIIDRSGGKVTLILGPLELSLSQKGAERLKEMLEFVLENEKVWV